MWLQEPLQQELLLGQSGCTWQPPAWPTMAAKVESLRVTRLASPHLGQGGCAAEERTSSSNSWVQDWHLYS
jgi:hypothetical protein